MAAVVSIVSALGVIGAALAGATTLIFIGAAFCLGAGVAAFLNAAPATPPPPASRKRRPGSGDGPGGSLGAERAGTLLLAALRNAGEGSERLRADLHRVLAGIVADERGTIEPAGPHAVAAWFFHSDHPAAAVHAAQRMLSNVDALSRRLGHDLRIAIGVHTGPKGEETFERTARVREAATESVPVLVSEPAARHLKSQLEHVDTIRADAWHVDLFTFPPAQKRLPGF